MSGCIEFEGAIDHNGYGRRKIEGKVWLAHRLAYRLAQGAIPDDKVVHHTCHNRSCINSEHLALLSREENGAQHKSDCSCSVCVPEDYMPDKCSSGHDLTDPKNTYRPPNNSGRVCLPCKRKRNRRYMRRVRSATRAR